MSNFLLAVLLVVAVGGWQRGVVADSTEELKVPRAPVRMTGDMKKSLHEVGRTGMEGQEYEPSSRLSRRLRQALAKEDEGGISARAKESEDKSAERMRQQGRRKAEETAVATDRIIGGKPLDTIGQYKWMSLLLIEITTNNTTQRNFVCNGALIALDFVLTGAACFWDPTTGQPRDSLYGATVGVRCRRADNCGQGSTLFTSPGNQWLVHPEFNYNVVSARNDVALVRLKNPTTTMPASALAVPDDGMSYYDGSDSLLSMLNAPDHTDLQILGGGWIMPRRYPDRMRKAPVTYVPQAECEASWELVGGALDGVLCTRAMTGTSDDDGDAGDGGVDIGLGQGSRTATPYEIEPNPNGGNICDGDGGAPVFLEGATSVNVTDSFFGETTVVKQDVVVGLASLTYNDGCLGKKLYPDMHAMVADSFAWIQRMVCRKTRVSPKPEWCTTPTQKKKKPKCRDADKTFRFQVDLNRPNKRRNCKYVKRFTETCNDPNLPDIPGFCPKTCDNCP